MLSTMEPLTLTPIAGLLSLHKKVWVKLAYSYIPRSVSVYAAHKGKRIQNLLVPLIMLE